ncbi:MAG TPA: DUF6516 family protein [Gammaproteobacteria bacterium]|nr:DUF6516 family protein [Gammaproteobacteria bacterium]
MNDGTASPGLDTLLDLDGERMVFEDGSWVKFEAQQIEATPERPHGIEYSLTYHDRYNRRILGFDNAHAVQSDRRGYHGRRVEYDHRHAHPKDKGIPYDFESPEQLVTDFWRAIEDWRTT